MIFFQVKKGASHRDHERGIKMTTEGFVKLPRTMLEWGWLDDGNTLKVYLVLLLSANWKEGEWHGIKVKRGQLITGRKQLAEKCHLSEQNIRTALEHLKSTKEITIEPKRQYSIITINNYDPDTNFDQQTNQPSTNDQPTANQASTNSQPTANQPSTTIEERKEEKEKKELKEKEEAAPPHSPSFNSSDSFNSSITRDELVEKYGIENVIRYERKLYHWKETKGIKGEFDDLKTIAKWLSDDNVCMLRGSSFDMKTEKQRILGMYKNNIGG